jgi:exopolysaccharide biosynthesis operon protein EpsL
MSRTTLHVAVAFIAALLALVAAPARAQHFDTVDTTPWPYTGRFPAYPAEPLRPTDFWVQGGALWDNNIFRLSKDANTASILGSGGSKSDEVLRLGGGVRTEQRVFSRQRVRLEARAEAYKFAQNSELDHLAYGLRGEWLWELTNDLSGTIGYERRKRLVDLAQIQRPVKDLITEQHAFATGAYMVGPSVRLRGALDDARGEHSDAAFNAAQVHIQTATGGIDYVTSLGNAFGVEYRHSIGNTPIQTVIGGVPVDNEFTEREVAAVATLVAGSQLRGTVRLGHTEREHKQFPERNFSGPTGRAELDWTPLQKTGFTFAAYREPRIIVDIASSYVIVTGFSFGPRWAPTEKLVFHALLLREHQDFAGDPSTVILGAPQRDEVVRAVRLGAGWEPIRFLELSAGIEHGDRTSNVFLRDYKYTALMVNAMKRF